MPAVAFRPPEQTSAEPCGRDFAAMRETYRVSGSIARGDDLARMLSEWQSGDFVSLAMLILARQVLSELVDQFDA